MNSVCNDEKKIIKVTNNNY